jgi:hypothetical protein
MALISRKSTTVSDHLNRASIRRHSGIHTVTAAMRGMTMAQTPNDSSKRESPFGPMVYGPEVGARPTAYKPILPMY